jgi:Flp pilus assembly protein TadD
LSLRTGQFKNAVPPLTKLLSVQTNNAQIELLLAMACLGSDDVDNALKHYQSLQKQFNDQPEIISGLAEISWRKKDTNAALQYYEQIVTNTAPDSPAYKLIHERINSLKAQ